MRIAGVLFLIGALVAFVPRANPQAGPARGTVEFNRDVRPILADACFHTSRHARRVASTRLTPATSKAAWNKSLSARQTPRSRLSTPGQEIP